MSNRLKDSLSPYLQHHASSPVDWYPWGPEAFEKARREDKPIFLSIGYSACHWCHVMERESFQNPIIARLLNEFFVPVKVDREERPDVDQIYLEAVEVLAGHAGWPLSVFLTPDLEPFFGGTYWPPELRGGMVGFVDVLVAVIDAWKNRRDKVFEVAAEVRKRLERAYTVPRIETLPRESLLGDAARRLAERFDPTWGGFGTGPKFPRTTELRLLLRHWAKTRDQTSREVVHKTLSAMAAGGIYDHLGGGFHRYTVDEAWLIPHFEKMLYDNALLALTYVEAWQAWKEPTYEKVARQTLDYMINDLRLPEGAFASSEDADSDGKEGKFYLWSETELNHLLGPKHAPVFLAAFTNPKAVVDGKYVLHQSRTLPEVAAELGLSTDEVAQILTEAKAKLLAARNERTRPFRDDKVIVAWNAFAIEAFALAGTAFSEPRYLQIATQCVDFLRQTLWQNDRLHHVWRAGKLGGPAFLEDYAALICALVQMYQITARKDYLSWAEDLGTLMIGDFADPQNHGFFVAPPDVDTPLPRRKDILDSAVPSGNALAATGLLYLSAILERPLYRLWANEALKAALKYFREAPEGCAQAVIVHDVFINGFTELVLCGPQGEATTEAARAAIFERFIPDKIFFFLPFDPAGTAPDAKNLPSQWLCALVDDALSRGANRTPILYPCRQQRCDQPAEGLEAIREVLARFCPLP